MCTMQVTIIRYTQRLFVDWTDICFEFCFAVCCRGEIGRVLFNKCIFFFKQPPGPVLCHPVVNLFFMTHVVSKLHSFLTATPYYSVLNCTDIS